MEMWKLQGLLKNEKKQSCKRCVVEDVKDEKSRKIAVVEEWDIEEHAHLCIIEIPDCLYDKQYLCL